MIDAGEEMASYIRRCTDELQRQSEACGGWPKPLRLPLPTTANEKDGLNAFVAQLQEQTGARIAIVFNKL